MLVIRKEQIKVLSEGRMREFEDEMVLHLADFSPPLYKVIKEDKMRDVVRFGFEQSEKYGFTLRGPMRLYLELMLLFGSHFDRDPQYPWAAAILFDKHSVSQMQRAEWLFEKILDYQEKVSGRDGINTRNALESLLTLAQNQLTFQPEDFEESLRWEMKRVFPQKADYVGREDLTALIRAGRAEAKKYELPDDRGEILMVVLKFMFGSGCADDLLYPWIGATLRDDKISDPKARVQRLEKKSVTWLEHVLGGSVGEVQV
jgi:hypothetical protein